MNRREFLRYLLAGGVFLGFGGYSAWQENKQARSSMADASQEYHRILVLGDPHLPVRTLKITDEAKQQRILTAKRKVIDDIQQWQDISRIAVLGDISAQFGIEEEYSFAKEYFAPLSVPVDFITGNHDFIYEDKKDANGHFVLCSPERRQEKLQAFQSHWQLPSLSYAHTVGNYYLIYLSADGLSSSHLAELQSGTIAWLQKELTIHHDLPTIILFHAPLDHTLESYNKSINTPDFIAQPETTIQYLIKTNPQIKLWVSGHTHTPATNPSYAAAVNRYEARVENIHTPDMDRETIWTNSLYLYPDKIQIRTYNHHTQNWEEALDRIIKI